MPLCRSKWGSCSTATLYSSLDPSSHHGAGGGWRETEHHLQETTRSTYRIQAHIVHIFLPTFHLNLYL